VRCRLEEPAWHADRAAAPFAGVAGAITAAVEWLECLVPGQSVRDRVSYNGALAIDGPHKQAALESPDQLHEDPWPGPFARMLEATAPAHSTALQCLLTLRRVDVHMSSATSDAVDIEGTVRSLSDTNDAGRGQNAGLPSRIVRSLPALLQNMAVMAAELAAAGYMADVRSGRMEGASASEVCARVMRSAALCNITPTSGPAIMFEVWQALSAPRLRHCANCPGAGAQSTAW
jgi:hypothetical protein